MPLRDGSQVESHGKQFKRIQYQLWCEHGSLLPNELFLQDMIVSVWSLLRNGLDRYVKLEKDGGLLICNRKTPGEGSAIWDY